MNRLRRSAVQIFCACGVLATIAVLLVPTFAAVTTTGPGEISTDEPSPPDDDDRATRVRVDQLASEGDCPGLLQEYEAAWEADDAGMDGGDSGVALVYYIEERIFALGCDQHD